MKRGKEGEQGVVGVSRGEFWSGIFPRMASDVLENKIPASVFDVVQLCESEVMVFSDGRRDM